MLLIELHTPAAPSTDHTMKTETTVTMPKAIASRNDTFITDQGSIRLRRSRARRGSAGGRRCRRRTTGGLAHRGGAIGDWVWIDCGSADGTALSSAARRSAA